MASLERTPDVSVDLAKSGSFDGDPTRAEVGDGIDHEFTVTNSGNVTLGHCAPR